MLTKLASLKLKNEDIKTLSSRGILAMKWHDKKYVYMISTKHSYIDLKKFFCHAKYAKGYRK